MALALTLQRKNNEARQGRQTSDLIQLHDPHIDVHRAVGTATATKKEQPQTVINRNGDSL